MKNCVVFLTQLYKSVMKIASPKTLTHHCRFSNVSHLGWMSERWWRDIRTETHVQVISCEALPIRQMMIIGCSLLGYHSVIKMTLRAQLVTSAVRHTQTDQRHA